MDSAKYISDLLLGCSRITVITGKRKKVKLMNHIRNKGTLPCDFCNQWRILKSVDNKYVLCDECREAYMKNKPERHERIKLDLCSKEESLSMR